MYFDLFVKGLIQIIYKIIVFNREMLLNFMNLRTFFSYNNLWYNLNIILNNSYFVPILKFLIYFNTF